MQSKYHDKDKNVLKSRYAMNTLTKFATGSRNVGVIMD